MTNAPGPSRTSDTRFRKPLLFHAELLGRVPLTRDWVQTRLCLVLAPSLASSCARRCRSAPARFALAAQGLLRVGVDLRTLALRGQRGRRRAGGGRLLRIDEGAQFTDGHHLDLPHPLA